MPENKAPLKRKKRKRKSNIGYLILFALVFVTALYVLLYAVKSFSPEVDVTIGNNESLTLSEQDMEVEIKTVDERLKWIQMEDELPTVSIRTAKEKDDKSKQETKQSSNSNENTKNKKNKEEKKTEAPRPNMNDAVRQKLDFRLRNIEPTETKPAISKVTKVYLGNYKTVEDAMRIQKIISTEESDIVPFIKSINGQYVVQIGSFSDIDKAQALTDKMKTKGYPAKLVSEK